MENIYIPKSKMKVSPTLSTFYFCSTPYYGDQTTGRLLRPNYAEYLCVDYDNMCLK